MSSRGIICSHVEFIMEGKSAWKEEVDEVSIGPAGCKAKTSWGKG